MDTASVESSNYDATDIGCVTQSWSWKNSLIFITEEKKNNRIQRLSCHFSARTILIKQSQDVWTELKYFFLFVAFMIDHFSLMGKYMLSTKDTVKTLVCITGMHYDVHPFSNFTNLNSTFFSIYLGKCVRYHGNQWDRSMYNSLGGFCTLHWCHRMMIPDIHLCLYWRWKYTNKHWLLIS